jgi:hypothetical protein
MYVCLLMYTCVYTHIHTHSHIQTQVVVPIMGIRDTDGGDHKLELFAYAQGSNILKEPIINYEPGKYAHTQTYTHT